MAKVNLQYKPSNENKFKGPIDVLRKAYSENGVGGVYKGMQTQILKAVLCQAILSMSKEQVRLSIFFLYFSLMNGL